MKRTLCKVGDLKPGQMRAVKVDRLNLVVVRGRDGGFRVLRDTCAHQGAALSRGVVQPMIVSDAPGRYAIKDGKDVLRCPWHAYEYDIDTGRSPSDPERVRVKAYTVTVEGDDVMAEI